MPHQHDVHESEDGPPQEESQVPPDLPQQAGPVAHQVLLLVGEEVVLEPEVDHPLGLLVARRQPELVAQVLVGKLGPAQRKESCKLLFL